MAAKLDQEMQPDFNRMINLLGAEERKKVSRQFLIDLEMDIIVRFGVDFNFVSAIPFTDRYLYLLGVETNELIVKMAYKISKYLLTDLISLK